MANPWDFSVGSTEFDFFEATEWSGGKVIALGGLPGSIGSDATGINDAGQVVGWSYVGISSDFQIFATEWTDGHVIDLGGLPDSTESLAYGINDAGQVVGYSVVDGGDIATEWSDGKVIDLGGPPGSVWSEAFSINDAGQVVGLTRAPRLPPVPESSTWAMMLFGFAGLAFAGYSRARPLRMF